MSLKNLLFPPNRPGALMREPQPVRRAEMAESEGGARWLFFVAILAGMALGCAAFLMRLAG